MDDTVKKLDSMVGGRERLNSAVSRKQLTALADRVAQQEEREKEIQSHVEKMVCSDE